MTRRGGRDRDQLDSVVEALPPQSGRAERLRSTTHVGQVVREEAGGWKGGYEREAGTGVARVM